MSGDMLALVTLPAEGVSLEEIERTAIVLALERCAWVQVDAALLLRTSPRVLNYKIQTLGIELPAEHPNVKRYAHRRRARAVAR